MTRVTSPIPEDFGTLTPHLTVRGAARAIEFYHAAFGAEELLRNLGPDGISIMHAELLLGDSRFFINDEYLEHGTRSPLSLGGTAVTLHLYVADVDAFFARAINAGAESLIPVTDGFWGDRYGRLRDPFGHHWSVASRVEDLSPQELQTRAAQFALRHTAGRPAQPDRESRDHIGGVERGSHQPDRAGGSRSAR